MNLTKEEKDFIKKYITEERIIDPEILRYGKDSEECKKISLIVKSIRKKLK